MTRVLNKYIADARESRRRRRSRSSGDDMREGLSCVLSVKVPEPKFSAQTKDKLVSSEVRAPVEEVVAKALEEFLLENAERREDHLRQDRRRRARARRRSQGARDDARRKGVLDGGRSAGQARGLPGEGPGEVGDLYRRGRLRRGGSAKQGRDRRSSRAILPLRGKVLNVEKARYRQAAFFGADRRRSITALGCGIGKEDLQPR